MQQRIQAVFQEVFDNPTLSIRDETSARDLVDWDSFAHVKLIIALEEEFGLKFTTNEVAEMTCVGDLKKALERKGVGRG